MVYDCSTFFDGFDMLEIRLNELKDVVDQFVICESTHDFAGKPKRLFLSENMSRFSKFPIRILILDEPESSQEFFDLWGNEERQKNYLKVALKNCNDDDIIMMGDADEIPFRNVVDLYRSNGWMHTICSLGMYLCYYYLNVVQDDYLWGSAFITTWKRVKETEMFSLRNNLGWRETLLSPYGYHFSYIGGLEVIKFKFNSFTHKGDFSPECYTEENIKMCLRDLKDLFGRPSVLKAHNINDLPGFPKYIIDNYDRFKEFIREV